MLVLISGWIGTILFIVCFIPQAWQSIKQKHSDGINLLFTILITIGEIAYLTYGIGLVSWPIIINNSIGLILTSIIMYYRIFPRRKI